MYSDFIKLNGVESSVQNIINTLREEGYEVDIKKSKPKTINTITILDNLTFEVTFLGKSTSKAFSRFELKITNRHGQIVYEETLHNGPFDDSGIIGNHMEVLAAFFKQFTKKEYDNDAND
jgi:hypothetical protein